MTTQLSDGAMRYTNCRAVFLCRFYERSDLFTDFSALSGDLHIFGCAGQESSDLVFVHWYVQEPNFIVWTTAVVYCQEKRTLWGRQLRRLSGERLCCARVHRSGGFSSAFPLPIPLSILHLFWGLSQSA